MKYLIIFLFFLLEVCGSEVEISSSSQAYQNFFEEYDNRVKNKSSSEIAQDQRKTDSTIEELERQKRIEELEDEKLNLEIQRLDKNQEKFQKDPAEVKKRTKLLKSNINSELNKYSQDLFITEFVFLEIGKGDISAIVKNSSLQEKIKELELRIVRSKDLSKYKETIKQIDEIKSNENIVSITEKINNEIDTERTYKNTLSGETQYSEKVERDFSVTLKKGQLLASNIIVKEINENYIIIGKK